MSTFLAVLIQSAPVIVEPRPEPVRPTLESETKPAFDLSCSLVDPLLGRHALRLEQGGGRGYVDPRFEHSNQRFRSTRLTFRIVEDETGLFSASRLIGENDGYRLARVEGRHPEWDVVRLETFPAGPQRLAAIVYVHALAYVKYTGFCDVVRHAQEPLTEAETAEVLAR